MRCIIGIKPNVRSGKFLFKTMSKYNVPKLVKQKKLHSSLIISDNKILRFKPKQDEIVATITSIEIWRTRGDKNALILILNSPELLERHTELSLKYDIIQDMEYLPHITLSYNIGDYDPVNLFRLIGKNIALQDEYKN